MRTREEINAQRRANLDKSTTSAGAINQELSAVIELLFDIRDHLAVHKARKTISADVPLTEREQTLLNSLGNDDEQS